MTVHLKSLYVYIAHFNSKDHTLTYRFKVVGNVVDGHPTAGMVDIAAPMLQASQGEVESITFDPPSMKIKNGPTIKINDPNSVYSKGYTLKPFYTADDANPSISSFQGFPMCIPRSSTDLLCPLTNRPKADK
jgi:hypothetical protein